MQLERSTIDAMAASPCPGPAAPFATWPKHWRQSTGFAWYTQPAVLVTQAAHAHATVEAAVNAINVINFVLAKREADISAAGGLLILHDWRLVTSWDADARRHLMNRARTHDKRLVRGVLVAMTVNPILGACLQTACMPVFARQKTHGDRARRTRCAAQISDCRAAASVARFARASVAVAVYG